MQQIIPIYYYILKTLNMHMTLITSKIQGKDPRLVQCSILQMIDNLIKNKIIDMRPISDLLYLL